MFPDDPIGESLRRYLAGLQVPQVSPDATRTLSRNPASVAQPQRSVGPQSQPTPRYVDGALGALYGVGEQGHEMFRHPVKSAAEMTGVPSMARGLRDGDVGQLALGAVAALPLAGMAGRGLGVLGRAGARAVAQEAAASVAPGMLNAEQLGEWRKIGAYLEGSNARDKAGRVSSEVLNARPVAPRDSYMRPGVEDMEIPMTDVRRGVELPRVSADSAVSRAARGGATFLSRKDHTTGFMDGMSTVKYSTPGGEVKVLFSQPEKGKLSIDYIGGSDNHEDVTKAGLSAVRDIIKDLRERTGATSVTGQRITGVRSSADPLTQTISKKFKGVADSVAARGVAAKLPQLSRRQMTTEAPSSGAVPIGYEIQGPQGISGVLKTKETARRRLDQMDNAHGSYAHKIVPLYAHPRAEAWQRGMAAAAKGVTDSVAARGVRGGLLPGTDESRAYKIMSADGRVREHYGSAHTAKGQTDYLNKTIGGGWSIVP